MRSSQYSALRFRRWNNNLKRWGVYQTIWLLGVLCTILAIAVIAEQLGKGVMKEVSLIPYHFPILAAAVGSVGATVTAVANAKVVELVEWAA